jgi:hypothetical protein
VHKSAACLVILLVLAGCAGKPKVDPAPAQFQDLGLKADDGTGVIRGVVVDSAIKPIAGAVVTLVDTKEEATTDSEGRFGYSNVAPGPHFLTADKAGFGAIQTSVEVVAGETAPRATIIQMVRVPGTEPRVMMLEWHGFMQCSWTAGGAFATGCLIGSYTDDDSRKFDVIEGQPAFLQSEVLWKATQTLGTSFCMRHYASQDIGGTVLMDDVCGPSPLLQQADAARLNETGVGTSKGIERLVWVDGYGTHQGPGFALNQKFDLFTTLFYNFVPDPDWRFVDDGPYPVPG